MIFVLHEKKVLDRGNTYPLPSSLKVKWSLPLRKMLALKLAKETRN
jgi:hypothetical protein